MSSSTSPEGPFFLSTGSKKEIPLLKPWVDFAKNYVANITSKAAAAKAAGEKKWKIDPNDKAVIDAAMIYWSVHGLKNNADYPPHDRHSSKSDIQEAYTIIAVLGLDRKMTEMHRKTPLELIHMLQHLEELWTEIGKNEGAERRATGETIETLTKLVGCMQVKDKGDKKKKTVQWKAAERLLETIE